MVADANELDDLHWLKSMASKELDLRPPSLVRIGRICLFFDVVLTHFIDVFLTQFLEQLVTQLLSHLVIYLLTHLVT